MMIWYDDDLSCPHANEQTVFLIDHLWCTTSWGAREQLKAHPIVRRNMQYILGLGK